MPLKYTSLIATFLLIFIFVKPSIAQDTRPLSEEAESLKTMFEEMLGSVSTMNEDGAQIVSEGEVLVEDSGRYYAVTLPHIKIEEPEGGYTDIGMIAVNAMPGDTPSTWKMTMSLPSPIIAYDKNDQPLVSFEIEGQNFAGLWHEEYKTFLKLDARYSDTKITHHEDDMVVMIPRTDVLFDFRETEDGLWSGPTRVDLHNVQFMNAENENLLNFGKMSFVSTIRDYSFNAAENYEGQINALAESFESGDKPSISGPHILGLYNMFFNFLGSAWDSFDFHMTLQDIAFVTPATETNPAHRVAAREAGISFEMGGFRAGSVSIGMAYKYDDLSISPEDGTPPATNAVPTAMNLDIQINNLPYDKIVDLGRTALKTSVEQPEKAQMAGIQTLLLMPKLLTEARTNMTLSETYVRGADYNVEAGGRITADMNAVAGAVGQGSARIQGLDNILATLQETAADPEIDQERKQKIQQTLAGLSILKMVGQIEKNEAGDDVRVYNLELNEAGQTTLNGTDLKSVMQATKKP